MQFCLNLKITFLVLYFAGVNLICIHITPRPVLKIFFFFFYSEINLNINQNSWSKFVHTMLYNIFLCFKFLGLVMKILPLCQLYRNLNGLTKDKTQGYLITQNSSSLHDDIKHLLSRKCIYILYDHPYN